MIDPQKWLTDSFPEEIGAGDLQSACAQNIVRLAGSDEYGAIKLLEARRSGDDLEVIILEVEVSLGQRPTENDVRAKEKVAVICRGYLLPTVRTMRADFPDVPHLNITDLPTPRSLCLYDEPEAEVMQSWTALSFVERIRWWLQKTAYGELHGEAQPLDPILYRGTTLTLIVDEKILEAEQPDAITLKGIDPEKGGLGVLHLSAKRDGDTAVGINVSALVVVTQPQEHGRLRYAPANLAELKSFDAEFDLGIFRTIEEVLIRWSSEKPDHLHKGLVLLLVIPIEREKGKGIESVSMRAFWTPNTAGEVGEALGILDLYEDRDRGEKRWSILLQRGDVANLELFDVYMGDVRREFSSAMAAEASGVNRRETKVTQIGVGSLGAQISLALAQQGYGRWTFVDNDRLFPHNLARHPLPYFFVGKHKAPSLAIYLNNLVHDTEFSKAIACNALAPGASQTELSDALQNAEFVLDTSASIPVARHLSIDVGVKAPIMSVFFNPTGTDVVILWEGADKTVRLDDCEMMYYTSLVSSSNLSGHLSSPGFPNVHGAACREPSAQMPQTRVIRLAGMAADSLLRLEDRKGPSICIWRDQEDGLVRNLETTPPPFKSTKVRDWEVRYSQSVIDQLQKERIDAGKIETGGVLIGAWDRQRKIVYVTGFTGPPPDSKRDAFGFIRGIRGLRAAMEKVSTATLDNLGYVGEWHSHPERHAANLSGDDRAFLREMKERTLLEDAPALMLVAGEDGVRCAVMHPGKDKEESELLG